MATVILARHGETTWNRDGRVQGWAPSRLTTRGHEQAVALGGHLAETFAVDRLVSSDLRRARETTRHVGRSLGLDPTFDSAWRERDFGFLQGLTKAELFDGYPQYAVENVGYSAALETPTDGESFLDTRERVLDAWEALCAGLHTEETAVVVAHGGPIRFVLADCKGLDVVSSITEQRLDNCCVNEIRVDSDPVVVRENDTSFLSCS